MKPLFAALILSTTALAGDTFDDMLLRDGTVLKNVEVKEVTARGLKVTHKSGSGLIKTEQLPAEVKKRYAAQIAAVAKATPESPANTESAKPARVIPGVEPAQVVLLCEKQGLTVRARASTVGNEWVASRKDETVDISVTATGPNKNSISAITSAVAGNDAGLARTALGSLAALPYTGAEPARAKQWVHDHIDADDAKTTIGGVTLHISGKAGTPRIRTLQMTLP